MSCQLSIIINVKNGESTIERCLSSLSKFEDIIVFDNYSTDRTLEIAKKYPNVTIVEHEFCGMGRVRNLAAAYAKNDWILYIDCDELLHPNLVDKLLNFNYINGIVYSILRHNYYANSWVNSSSWENDWVIRLFNRTETKYSEVQVHEGVIHKHLKIEQIHDGFIYHFPYDEVSQLINKMQLYSSWYAKDKYPNKYPTLWLIPFRAFSMFIKCYILKRGFLDGFPGFVVSAYNAIGVFSKYVKLYELHTKKNIGLAINVSSDLGIEKIVNVVNAQSLLPQDVYFVTDTNLNNNVLNRLCVSYKVISRVDLNNLNQQIENNKNLDCILYIEDINILNSTNLLKKCKKAILNGKKLDKIQLINLR